MDRVRIQDKKDIQTQNDDGSNRKLGWRQKSLSYIDLSLRSKDFHSGQGAFRYKDFDSIDNISFHTKNMENSDLLNENCSFNPKGSEKKNIGIHQKLKFFGFLFSL